MFRYRFTLTLMLLFVLCATSTGSFAATRPMDPVAPQGEFLTTQIKTLVTTDSDRAVASANSYLSRQASFLILVAQLKLKNGNLTLTEKTQLATEADGLKRELRTLQTSLASIVQKLKDNNKFTPELDSYINAYLRSKTNTTAVVRFIEQENQARNILSSAGTRISAQITSIDALVQQVISGASNHHPPAVASSRFVCGVLTFKLIVKVLRGTDTEKDSNDFQNECRDVTT